MVNRNKPDRWKDDVRTSVDMYNDWFLRFAPQTFRSTRVIKTLEVEDSLLKTDYLRRIEPADLIENPAIIPTLRMSTCPPLAVDRLIGLSGAPANLVKAMDKGGRIPPRMLSASVMQGLEQIVRVIKQMADPDIFVWLARNGQPTQDEAHRAATIVADRLTGAASDPIIRNAQEQRQLAAIGAWLDARGYQKLPATPKTIHVMPPGTYSFRTNVLAQQGDELTVNIPIDALVMPMRAQSGELPLMIEAKSAGDFTNTNKRRKEEAVKVQQLRATLGSSVRFILFLCGYFDGGYLGYEASEGIDWVWEHRMDDLAEFGL